jgi:hypothetical protein
MFRKFFASNKRKKNKKRLSPSARTAEGMMNSHPMYQYAMKEYAQTVPHVEGGVSDDGRIQPSFSMNQDEDTAAVMEEMVEHQQQHHNHATESVEGNVPLSSSSSSLPSRSPSMHKNADITPSPSILRVPSYKSDITTGTSSVQKAYQRIVFSPKTEYVLSEDEEDGNSAFYAPPQYPSSSSQAKQQPSSSIYLEPPMPDSTYEEWYGDAYVGGPIKYIYPSGMHTMRPRSGPWKLSIVVCLLFTWLSVFVIGHCSDKAAEQYDGFYNYNANYNKNNNADGAAYNDDANNANGQGQQYRYVDTNEIDMKWCGSVLLYWLWVISMLITGLATAYCGVIGYIKVRDFAVANSRSQPPGVAAAKSDYYVQIRNGGAPPPGASSARVSSGQQVHPSQYQPTIYQADGTPQFWGNQIYRPTQAAVAITSR